MKKCILCGEEHVNGCDKSEWDGVVLARFAIPQGVAKANESILLTYTISASPNQTENGDGYLIELEEAKALKEEEHNHIVKRRGRLRRA